jgi:16S rRNA (cytosine967-C5)-methyltransferase
LINAVLRAAQRRTNELREKADAQPLSIRFSHPDFLIARWSENFGEEAAAAMAELNNHPAPVYLRINCLKIRPEEFFGDHPQYKPIPKSPDFFQANRLPSDALCTGLVYAQDPSTTVACDMLDPQPNERILDACAAPGGKTSLLAQRMTNRGAILACDRDNERLKTLRQNLDRLGVAIAEVKKIDWTAASSEKMTDEFDRILLDAACSNTGVARRRVDVRWRLRPDDFARMQKRQLTIARKVVTSLKPGGVLVYSTCSLEPEENEQVVAELLNEFKDMQLLEQKIVTPFADGFDGAFAAKLRRVR